MNYIIELLLILANLSGGLLLSLSIIKLMGSKSLFVNISSVLSPLQVTIGSILILLSIFTFLDNILFSLISVAGGLFLLQPLFAKFSSIEHQLNRLTTLLSPFKGAIGIALIIVGIAHIFGLSYIVTI